MPTDINEEETSQNDVEREKVAIAAEYLGVNNEQTEIWSTSRIMGEKYSRIKSQAEFLRAFTDENRMDIVIFLMHSGVKLGHLHSYSVSEIATRFNISLSTVSHHLQELKRVGVVKVERRGKERYYQLDLDYIIERVGTWYETLLHKREKISRGIDPGCSFAEEQKKFKDE